MILKYEFETVDVVGEKMAIPITNGTDSFHGAIRVNEVASDILNLLKTDTTEDAMIETLLNEYNATREQIAESVHRVVAQLREADLLAE